MFGFLQRFTISDKVLNENQLVHPSAIDIRTRECHQHFAALDTTDMNGSNPRYMQFGGDWSGSHSSSFSFDDEKPTEYGSFGTSGLYGQSNESTAPPPAPRPKKFFKSRDASSTSASDSAPIRKFDLSTLYGPRPKLSKKPPKKRVPPPATKSGSGRKVEIEQPAPPPPFLHRSPLSREPATPTSHANSEEAWNSANNRVQPIRLVMKKTGKGFQVDKSPTSPPHAPASTAPKSRKERLLKAHERVMYDPLPAPPDFDPAADIRQSGIVSRVEDPPSFHTSSVSTRSERYARRARSPKTSVDESQDSFPADETSNQSEDHHHQVRQRSKSPRGPKKRTNSGRKRKRGGAVGRSAGPRPKKPSPPPLTWEDLLGKDAVVVTPSVSAPVHETEENTNASVDSAATGSDAVFDDAFSDHGLQPASLSEPEPPNDDVGGDLEAAMEALHSDTDRPTLPEAPHVEHRVVPPLQLRVRETKAEEQAHIPSAQPVETAAPASRQTRRNRRGLNDIVQSLIEPHKAQEPVVEQPTTAVVTAPAVVKRGRGRPPKVKPVAVVEKLPSSRPCLPESVDLPSLSSEAVDLVLSEPQVRLGSISKSVFLYCLICFTTSIFLIHLS